jgi:mannose-6-phosphate isomerase-like protein (cupin superfamily)
MSYPPPRYLGSDGEQTATYRPGGTKPEWTYANGNTVHYLATGATTNGQFGLYRWEMGPQPSGPDPHFHRSISESFYILLGSVRIFDGKRWIDTVPGDFVHVPEGGVHAFRNESGEPASMLLHFSPGAPREAYFDGLPDLSRMTGAERATFMLDHDTFWT